MAFFKRKDGGLGIPHSFHGSDLAADAGKLTHLLIEEADLK